jgi:HD-GYP domain-containing protein (c-di-GMP phosphodiesterase class II)
MNYVLLHTPTWSPREFLGVLPDRRIEVRQIGQARELTEEDRPTVFVLDAASRAAFPYNVLRAFVDAGGAVVALGAEDEADVPETIPGELLSGFVRHPARAREILVSVRAGFREAAARLETARARDEAAQRSREIHDLTRIGVALGAERDIGTLLEQILTQARKITRSDAGSLYLVDGPESNPGGDAGPAGMPSESLVAAVNAGGSHSIEGVAPGRKRLRFLRSQNHSRPDIPFVEFTIPVDRTSLAGYTATTGEPLVIEDAYNQPPDVEYTINRSFDERYGYHTKSLLVIPMRDHKDEIIGVLQLINRKRTFEAVLATPQDVAREVMPYSKRAVELATALAGHAGVAIENGKLYEEIEQLIQGLVNASVTAIEQRDPVTEGHSQRVADMTEGLAKVVDRAEDGRYHDVRFTRDQLREIRYAGLLHDFGKVGVKEHVLRKEKKLPPVNLAVLEQRHAFLRRSAERAFWQRRAEYLEQHGRDGYDRWLRDVEAAYRDEVATLDRFLDIVRQANEPTVLPADITDGITTLAAQSYEALDGSLHPLLGPDDVRYLSIRKGSLDDAERREIESHVTHTYTFLQQIHWTRELKRVPEIAWGHHEKMDGTGYPRGVRGVDIPIQTRMMTISDIYDALAAQNRPYKKKVPLEKALDILADEVKSGHLDAELFRLFVAGEVYKLADPTAG